MQMRHEDMIKKIIPVLSLQRQVCAKLAPRTSSSSLTAVAASARQSLNKSRFFWQKSSRAWTSDPTPPVSELSTMRAASRTRYGRDLNVVPSHFSSSRLPQLYVYCDGTAGVPEDSPHQSWPGQSRD